MKKTPHLVAVLALSFFALGAFAQEQSTSGEMSLADQLRERKNAYKKRAPKERTQMVQKAVQEIKDSGILDDALKVGDQAPDFTLEDPLGRPVALSTLLADGPVILAWYRGNWCPYCNIQLRDYQKKLDRITAAGGQLVAISPETPDNALTMEEKNDLEFKVVSDLGNQVGKRYGIVYQIPKSLWSLYGPEGLDLAKYNGDDSMELPLGVTYIVKQDGTIGYAFVSEDYTERAETDELIEYLEGLAKT